MLFHRSYDDNTKSSKIYQNLKSIKIYLERKYSRLFDWGHHLSREGNNLPRYMRKAERINEQTLKKRLVASKSSYCVFITDLSNTFCST